MPTEAQLKAQMQAAIAKKKQEQEAKVTKPTNQEPTKAPETSPSDMAPAAPKVTLRMDPIAPPPIATSPAQIIEPVIPHVSDLDRRPPVEDIASDGPVPLTFYGHPVRFTVHKGDVYFAVIDLLPISKDPNYQNKLIEFRNNPKTKEAADSLIKILTFHDQIGTQKIEGATAADMLVIFRELKLSAPGPMGRWLKETAATHVPKGEK